MPHVVRAHTLTIGNQAVCMVAERDDGDILLIYSEPGREEPCNEGPFPTVERAKAFALDIVGRKTLARPRLVLELMHNVTPLVR